jgi:hypothetical protein
VLRQFYDLRLMATIEVFRTYPAPKQSWRSYEIRLDGHVVGRIGGAGYKRFSVGEGTHRLSVHHRGEDGPGLVLDAANGHSKWVLVGENLSVAECSSVGDLPRCAIPLTDASGQTQSMKAGRSRAVRAGVVLNLVTLGFFLFGAGIVIRSVTERDYFRVMVGAIGIAIGLLLFVKIWPGTRIMLNQWSWPLEQWRIEDKAAGFDEWRRWAD